MPPSSVFTVIDVPLLPPPLIVPPPAVTLKVTGTPAAATPPKSRMITDGGLQKVSALQLLPARAFWDPAELFLISTSTALPGLDQGPRRLAPTPPRPSGDPACSGGGRNSRALNHGRRPRALPGRA